MEGKPTSAIVTGCAGYIGHSICDVLREHGHLVIGIDKKESCNHCDRHLTIDLAEFVKNKTLQNKFSGNLYEAIGSTRLVGLVNNAAIQLLRDGLEVLDDFQTTLDVNVTAAFLLSNSMLDRLELSRGAIINIGSVHSHLTKPKFVAYATSKAALKGLTQSMAIDLADRGIRVNIIEPGATDTPMLTSGFDDDENLLSELANYQPLKRFARPEEIAKLTAFLLSKDADFITGASISIDGGVSVRLHDPG